LRMALAVGDRLPDADLARLGDGGPEAVQLRGLLAGRKVVIFAVPGAFTPTCSTAHVPSFIRTREALAEKGIDEVICISVNDPHVMRAWDRDTGAGAAGITMLADPESAFTKAVGMAFTAPSPAGLVDRSLRYALYAVDGEVRVLHAEKVRGSCEISGGEAMLAAI